MSLLRENNCSEATTRRRSANRNYSKVSLQVLQILRLDEECRLFHRQQTVLLDRVERRSRVPDMEDLEDEFLQIDEEKKFCLQEFEFDSLLSLLLLSRLFVLDSNSKNFSCCAKSKKYLTTKDLFQERSLMYFCCFVEKLVFEEEDCGDDDDDD